MLFNSYHFLLFFPLVIAGYYLLPQRWRWLFLLAASYYFYMCWKMEYIVLILASTGVDYVAGLKMAATKNHKRKKQLLFLSLFVNIGLLIGFKYFNFFNDSIRHLFNACNVFYGVGEFKALLPVGISFYTFQTLSYIIDVYRGKGKAEAHFGRFALYVAFFPQLVAGPIERSTRLLPQLRKKISFQSSNIHAGLKLMLWGFFKKTVVADRLAYFVGAVFTNPGEYTGLTVFLAAFLMHLQVYADLSGYTDIARGAARVMGIDLMKNFRMPYLARSLRDFWKRWHISLTSWFTDYLYISLGGNRVVKWRWYYNILVVFLVSGLWHGANWTFVIWGFLHGAFQLLEILTSAVRKKVQAVFRLDAISSGEKFIRNAATAIHVLLLQFFLGLTMVFFGARELSDSMILLRNMFSSWSLRQMNNPYSLELIMGIAMLGVMMGVEWLHYKHSLLKRIAAMPVLLKWLLYAGGLFFVLLFGVFEEAEFIYFQF